MDIVQDYFMHGNSLLCGKPCKTCSYIGKPTKKADAPSGHPLLWYSSGMYLLRRDVALGAQQLGQQHRAAGSTPQGVPMTDGTPVACRQKNAKDFLAGDVQTSVMAHYAPGLFSTKQKLHSRHPAPDEDTAAVLDLVEWREDAPYG